MYGDEMGEGEEEEVVFTFKGIDLEVKR